MRARHPCRLAARRIMGDADSSESLTAACPGGAPPPTNEEIRCALARPAFYPHHPSMVEVRETHISWVFLAGDRAYKLKKPLVLDFLDYGTAARRRAMWREEVRLNRRLARELYLGVRAGAMTPDGLALTDDKDPGAVEFVVEMRRFDECRTLAARLDRGTLEPAELARIWACLAGVHAPAR